MKIPIVAANWKMHKTIGEAIDLAAEVKRRLADVSGVETVLSPPFTALKAGGDLLGFGRLRLGAQEMHGEPHRAQRATHAFPRNRRVGQPQGSRGAGRRPASDRLRGRDTRATGGRAHRGGGA